MRFSMRRFFIAGFMIYSLITISFMVKYFSKNNTVNKIQSSEPIFNKKTSYIRDGLQEEMIVDIWGKAAIGEYFWEHIFEGVPNNVHGKLLKVDTLKYDTLTLRYKTGPYLTYFTADRTIKNLVIVLNTREPSVVQKAKLWLDELLNKEKFNLLKNLGVIVLGNEYCHNDWLIEIYFKHRDIFKFVFIVYDIPISENDNIYQWPLGVATYRNFPLIQKSDIDETVRRKYKCNFMGTVYANSTRVKLMNLLKQSSKDFNCFVNVRFEWLSAEPSETKMMYHDVLKESDLTLCPVGINSESYRIYEALSYGSVPVIEDVMTSGDCGDKFEDSNTDIRAPFRILKELSAPVIFIKDWNQLPEIIEAEKELSLNAVIERRKHILSWYEIFRHQTREHFLSVLKTSFV